MDTELETAMLDALAEFAAGAGHEINNPLAVISGHAQRLLKEIRNEEQRRSLAIILTQAKRIHEMIVDLRVFARPPVPELELVQLDEILLEFADDAKIVCKKLKPFMCDGVQIRVILSELIKNAKEASADEIQVSAAQDGDRILLKVEDNGIGMTESERKLAFSPFFSGRESNRGLGFGLSKVWRLVQQLGGEIDISKREPKGTCVAVVFLREHCV